MKIGLIGLGRMGGNIARRLMRDGHQTVVYDNNPDARAALAKDGGEAVDSLEAMVKALPSPRAVWTRMRRTSSCIRARRPHRAAIRPRVSGSSRRASYARPAIRC